MHPHPRSYATPTDVHPHARRLIDYHVRALRGTRPLAVGDADDVRQELALHAHRVAGRHDPARGAAATFYDRVLAIRLAELRRHAGAARRDRRREVPGALVATIACRKRPDASLRLDVAAALAGLSPDVAALAAVIMAGDATAAAAARALAWTRQQVRHRRRLLARRLAAAGLAPAGTEVIR